MSNSRNLLVGLVAASISFDVGNNWMAIAQNSRSDRHLSEQEIQSLINSVQLSRVVNRVTDRVGLDDKRSQFEINSINQFVSAWQRVDPSIAPFLGNWSAYQENLELYPSIIRGQVCVIREYFAGSREGTKRLLNVGKVSGDKLITDGELGKRVFVKRKGILQKPSTSAFPNQEVEYVGMFGTIRGRNGFSAYVFPIALKEINDNRFTRLGCTASLPSKMQPQTSKQKHPAESIVSDFYTWYFRNNNTNYRRMLSQKRESFTPELYKNLDRAIRISDTSRGSGMLNFDVFSNAQVESYSFQIDSVASQENSAEVYLTLQTGLGYSRRRPNPIKVLVVKNNNRWQIADFVYLRESPNIYSLLPILRGINQKKEFSEIPWGNYGTIPSVPASSSSKPVKPTDTIAKYPTNDNFKKVDRILKASKNPESLVKLRGNQADQRRKFQKEWESRNPAAAKFLGAWYTGDRYFYVFPSTAKGGTCIVTQDTNGNLTMQIGTVLNRELRYSGGKGIFWIDRTNIVASRDSGSGDLYPIYATSEVPELSESIIGDMERQKCITKLP